LDFGPNHTIAAAAAMKRGSASNALPRARTSTRPIEAGTLTPEETNAVSNLVGAIGALGDTDDRAQALGHWQHVRELLKTALGEDAQ
jgi:hypothetical protein